MVTGLFGAMIYGEVYACLAKGGIETTEKRETSTFLTTILESKPWKVLYAFLRKKNHPFAKDPITFRYWMAQLWFLHYSRARGGADTSGFEHVFIGEVKNHEITGMHNWISFYQLDKNETKEFDYKGYVIKRGVRCNRVEIDGYPLAITSFDIVQNNKVSSAQSSRQQVRSPRSAREFGGRLTI
ncbi:unnamed protein product [Cylicocyclus nassatus]|uniref:EndoU domain-containing protein n=1 Tax=Cylicocyclus nassatus TaxID=53992 RepID=A0AA36H8L5_CYLNA|nr:unnamed protein product [Cylicocyclus nassatus]